MKILVAANRATIGRRRACFSETRFVLSGMLVSRPVTTQPALGRCHRRVHELFFPSTRLQEHR